MDKPEAGVTKAQQAQIREMVRARAEEARKVNKIGTYFPDTGEFRRELYKRHVEFFAAGAKYKERLFMAANRCLAPSAPVEMDHGARQCRELIGDSGFDVLSWDGGSRCTRRASPVFLRGIGPAFRLHLGNGQFFDCSGTHRVLTTAGWVAIDQLIRNASGLRCSRATSDYPANYGTASYPRGRRPLPWSDTDPWPLPLPAGAPGHGQKARPGDAAEPISEYRHAYPALDRFSNLDDPGRLADLCGLFEDPSFVIADLWSPGLRRELRQFANELDPRLRGGLCRTGTPLCDGHPSENESRGAGRTHLLGTSSVQVEQRSGFASSLVLSGAEFLEAEPHTEIFFPFETTSLLDATSIESIVTLGLQPILDFTVFGTHNYVSGGLISHNCGKSDAGALELSCHATGIYPHWWTGRRFNNAIEAWACGTTGETTRDIVQAKLLGPVSEPGTGMIPKHLILKTTSRRGGIADALESIVVKHVSGKNSLIGLKSYQQGRESFEGTAKEVVWYDEEPPQDIYTEGLYRTLTTRGIVYTTFTPLQGMSDVVRGFVEPEKEDSEDFKFYIQAGWNDVPHIHEDEKRAVIATTPPYQIRARTEGEPALGSGAIYPIAESEITIPSRAVPTNWIRCYAMDVGWDRTAVLWFAKNPGNGQLEIYDEHYAGQGEPPTHAMAIKGRGDWIPGVIDPASNGRSQVDGSRLLQMYRKLGLTLTEADNSVESGIQEVWTMLVSGQLKIHERCFNFFKEFRQYHRSEKTAGKIIKKHDHLMDACRYGITSGQQVMRLKPIVQPNYVAPYNDHNGRGWMMN